MTTLYIAFFLPPNRCKLRAHDGRGRDETPRVPVPSGGAPRPSPPAAPALPRAATGASTAVRGAAAPAEPPWPGSIAALPSGSPRARAVNGLGSRRAARSNRHPVQGPPSAAPAHRHITAELGRCFLPLCSPRPLRTPICPQAQRSTLTQLGTLLLSLTFLHWLSGSSMAAGAARGGGRRGREEEEGAFLTDARRG